MTRLSMDECSLILRVKILEPGRNRSEKVKKQIERQVRRETCRLGKLCTSVACTKYILNEAYVGPLMFEKTLWLSHWINLAEYGQQKRDECIFTDKAEMR